MGIFKLKIGFAGSLIMAILLAIAPNYLDFTIESIPPLPQPPVPAVPKIQVVEDTIQKNTTLVATLVDYEVPVAIAHHIADLVKPVFNLRRDFRVGNPFRLEREGDGTLVAFQYRIDDERILKVEKAADSYEAKVEKLQFETRESVLTSTIESSLWQALSDHPKGDYLVAALAGIFQWDVDFNTEIQKGDQIRFIVEELYHDGQFVKYGKLHAAQLTNAGKHYRGFLFKDSYYDDKGNALKREFLASPLKFTRISSGFTRRRMHPILGTVRAHLAVDYAAPTGTPVVAIASGTVTSAGWNGGYGRLVQIRHPNGLTSGYAHLSRIAPGVKPGVKIQQGEAVGSVGMTGLANGPHLHFMMTERGGPINPDQRLRKGGPRLPIAAAMKDEFKRQIAGQMASLETEVASAN